MTARPGLDQHYETVWDGIMRQAGTCPAIRTELRTCRDAWVAYAVVVLSGPRVPNTTYTNETVRHLVSLLDQTDSAWQHAGSACRALLGSARVVTSLRTFLEDESLRMASVVKLTQAVDAAREFHGPGHAAAILRFLNPDVKIMTLLRTPAWKAVGRLTGDMLRAIEVDLEPLATYKRLRDPSLARWSDVLRRYASSTHTLGLAHDLDAVRYWALEGLRAIEEDTGPTPNGRIRVPDLRVLDQMMELTTLGLFEPPLTGSQPPIAKAPSGLYTRLARQMGDIKASMGVAATFEPGDDPQEKIVEMLGSSGRIMQTDMMRHVHQKALRDPRMAARYVAAGARAVPLAVHRTDFDYVQALRNDPHLTNNDRAVLSTEINRAKAQKGETLPRDSRSEIARLRKQFSLHDDKFSASGRAVVPVAASQPLQSMWNQFEASRPK